MVEVMAKMLLEGLAELARTLASPNHAAVAPDTLAAALANHLGAPSCAVLLPCSDGLCVVAARGLTTAALGTTIPHGVGVVSVAARQRRSVRLSSIKNKLRYAAPLVAATRPAEAIGATAPLPTLRDVQSLLIVPLLEGQELIAVLFAESAQPSAFGPDAERAFEIAGALCTRALVRARDSQPEREAPPAPTLQLRYYPADDSVFLASDYLVKGVPGRLLRWIIEQHVATGRLGFTNKELRLELGESLPWARDNLESRLILLKRRLDAKACGVRLVQAGRGRLELVLTGPVTLRVETAH